MSDMIQRTPRELKQARKDTKGGMCMRKGEDVYMFIRHLGGDMCALQKNRGKLSVVHLNEVMDMEQISMKEYKQAMEKS